MGNKYYTPEIEEFHVGFEYEIKEESGKLDSNKTNYKLEWVKQIFTIEELLEYSFEPQDNYFKIHLEEKQFRVKFLDKQDIESLGFEFDYNYADSPELGFINEVQIKDNLQYMLYYNPITNKCRIERIFNCGTGKEDYLFNGMIKNKSELIKLLKQLEINDK